MIKNLKLSVNALKSGLFLAAIALLPGLSYAQDPLSIAPNGNVGVGINTPLAKLHVGGDLGVNGIIDLGINQPGRQGDAGKIGYSTFDNGALCIVGAGTNGGNRRITFWTEGGGRFYGPVNFQNGLNTTGNVGINLNNPAYTLDVNGNIGLKGTHLVYNSQSAVIDWGNGASGGLFFRRLNTQGDVNALTDIAFMGSNGNMGVGNTNPYNRLDVSGNIFTSIHGNESNEHDASHRGITRIGMQAQADNNDGFAGMELQTEAYQCGNGGLIKFYTWGCNTSQSREVMRINEGGRIGIGNTNPQAPLHVSGWLNHDLVNFYFMFRDECRKVANNNPHTNSISIQADNGIQAGSFYAMSDARIKTAIEVSDNASDLDRVKQVQVVDYNYKDYVQHGFDPKKGFIAQQVETVFPQAVIKGTGFIPDVYAQAEKTSLADGVLTITLKIPHQLASGDTVRLITRAGAAVEAAIQVVDAKTFTVNNWKADTGGLFVYGKKVQDFRAVDYQQVFAMGIGAIQELSKQVDALKAENAKLKAQAEFLQTTLAARLKSLEDKVNGESKSVLAAVEKPAGN
jgi:hypothetical protein